MDGKDFAQTQFDYEVLSGRGRGGRIDVCPGKDEFNPSLFINLDERPFFLFERFLLNELGDSTRYSHYGISRIPLTSWINALREFYDYSESLQLVSASKIAEEWAGYDEIVFELRQREQAFIAGVRQFCEGLLRAASRWPHDASTVFVFGI